MKKLLVVFLALNAQPTIAAAIEGRLIAKLQGELDPNVLGEGCISVVEYYDGSVEALKKIGIYQDESVTCISQSIEKNEEITLELKKLKLIKNKPQLEALKALTQGVMKVKGVKYFYKL